MKNGVELLVAELVSPIECRQILRHKIAAITREILEITRAKIVNYCQMCVRKLFLQCQREIRANESGAAGDN